jgi:hypothetical protein
VKRCARDVKRRKSQNPEHKENHEQRYEHIVPLLLISDCRRRNFVTLES